VSKKLLTPNFQIFQDGLLHPKFLGLSCQIPPLDRAIVRKAILLALNKREIARDVFDMKYARQVINNYIPSRLPGFFPRDDEESYDLEKAKQMLQEAGFSTEGEFPPLTLLIDLPRTEMKFKIYRALRKQLDALGIKLRLNYYRSLKEIKSYNKPYLVFTGREMSFPDPEDIIRPLFFSKSIFNIFNYVNPELDKLLQEAEIERSWTKRINLFHQIEKILISDVPALPLFSHQNRVAMQPYVRGVEVPSLGFYYLNARKIWLDK
jgi:ABC-type transport system substrate-binding protein